MRSQSNSRHRVLVRLSWTSSVTNSPFTTSGATGWNVSVDISFPLSELTPNSAIEGRPRNEWSSSPNSARHKSKPVKSPAAAAPHHEPVGKVSGFHDSSRGISSVPRGFKVHALGIEVVGDHVTQGELLVQSPGRASALYESPQSHLRIHAKDLTSRPISSTQKPLSS